MNWHKRYLIKRAQYERYFGKGWAMINSADGVRELYK